MNIVTVASKTVWKDTGKNILQTYKHVAKAKQMYPNVQVILFPELSLSGFVVDKSNANVAESLLGSAVSQIINIAKEFNVALICGIIEKNDNNKPYNTQFVISKNGKLLASYKKNHLFTQSAEPKVYTKGDRLAIFELEGWKCGLSTCFDIRFPRLFEAYKNAGVEIVFSGFNWVEGRNKQNIMDSLVKTRAHENQYFMVAVDRSGKDPNTRYYGKSVFANPFAEDTATRKGIYSYAQLNKNEITDLGCSLPLNGSYKGTYKI